VELQDEAATSAVAEERLRQSGKRYRREQIDAEAAAIILQDWLDNHADR
jgi:RNase H-fold protein (predicted Holliday junction resolvase)